MQSVGMGIRRKTEDAVAMRINAISLIASPILLCPSSFFYFLLSSSLLSKLVHVFMHPVV